MHFTLAIRNLLWIYLRTVLCKERLHFILLTPESNCFQIHLQLGTKSSPHRVICFLFGKQISRDHSDQACVPCFELDSLVNKTIPPNYSEHQHELPSLISQCVNFSFHFAFIESDMQYFCIKLNLAYMELFYTENARTWVVGRCKVNIEPLMGLGAMKLIHCHRPAMTTPSTSSEAVIKLCNSSRSCGINTYTNHLTSNFIYVYISI